MTAARNFGFKGSPILLSINEAKGVRQVIARMLNCLLTCLAALQVVYF